MFKKTMAFAIVFLLASVSALYIVRVRHVGQATSSREMASMPPSAETKSPKSGLDPVQVQQKAQEMVQDFADRHPSFKREANEDVRELEAKMADIIKPYERLMDQVRKESETLSQKKSELDRLILQGSAPDQIRTVNEEFEKIAVNFQKTQERLNQSYLKVMTAYDDAIQQLSSEEI